MTDTTQNYLPGWRDAERWFQKPPTTDDHQAEMLRQALGKEAQKAKRKARAATKQAKAEVAGKVKARRALRKRMAAAGIR